jgi:protein-tyrosine phosphatase
MSARRVPLAGAVNFRDVGGYAAADGRTVRWGLLHRSDSLAELTEADLETVHALGLRSVFDLRHDSERQQRPSRQHPDARHHTHAIGFFPHGSEALMAGVRGRSLSKDAAHGLLLAMYQHLPVDQAAVYGRMLQTLLLPDALPALVHCTSGKDRTGFGVSVLLTALGVPRETILEDYVLTNRYRRDLGFMLGHDVDAEVLDAVKAADPQFLLAAFEVMDTHWGGVDAFFQHGLGFSDEDRARLQDLMLEG